NVGGTYSQNNGSTVTNAATNLSTTFIAPGGTWTQVNQDQGNVTVSASTSVTVANNPANVVGLTVENLILNAATSTLNCAANSIAVDCKGAVVNLLGSFTMSAAKTLTFDGNTATTTFETGGNTFPNVQISNARQVDVNGVNAWRCGALTLSNTSKL